FGEEPVRAPAAERRLCLGLGGGPVEPVLHEQPRHALAHLYATHPVAHRNDLADAVGEGNEREPQLRVVKPLDDEQVAVVERPCAHFQLHLTVPGPGVGALDEGQCVQAEAPFDLERFHGRCSFFPGPLLARRVLASGCRGAFPKEYKPARPSIKLFSAGITTTGGRKSSPGAKGKPWGLFGGIVGGLARANPYREATCIRWPAALGLNFETR